MGIAATGRSIQQAQAHLARFRDGKGVEHRAVQGDLGLMQQLGVLPSESVRVSRRTTTRWLKLGRGEIRHASVSRLPFCDHMFDLVNALEAHFFRSDLVADMHKVVRVLKPGRKLIIIAAAYKGGKYDKRNQWRRSAFCAQR